MILQIAILALSVASLLLHFFKAPVSVDDIVDGVLAELKKQLPPQ